MCAASSIAALRREVISCRRCPRLVRYRESVKPRASFAGQAYWRKPVPGFGDVNARLLVLGIAPAALGGNRTGRVFTGDESGRFLVKALHRAGFASIPVSESRDDGLVYDDCYLTAAVKCAPPGDKPTRAEFENCSRFLDQEMSQLTNLRAVLALGGLAFASFAKHAKRQGRPTKGLVFAHGASYIIPGMPKLWASYHPSPRNTNTGKLTQRMLVDVLLRIKLDLARGR
jgi:uracil-DNA glycosylase family 4